LNLKEKEELLEPMFELLITQHNNYQKVVERPTSVIEKNLSELEREASKLESFIVRPHLERIQEMVLINITHAIILMQWVENHLIYRDDYIYQAIEKMKEIMINKSSDYASDEDVLANFRVCEKLFDIPDYTGISIRLSDKLSRVKNLIKDNNPKVKDESLEDTLIDLANYSLLFYLCVKEKYDFVYLEE